MLNVDSKVSKEIQDAFRDRLMVMTPFVVTLDSKNEAGNGRRAIGASVETQESCILGTQKRPTSSLHNVCYIHKTGIHSSWCQQDSQYESDSGLKCIPYIVTVSNLSEQQSKKTSCRHWIKFYSHIGI